MRVGRLAAMVLFLSLGIGLALRPAAAASALEIDAEVVAALTRFDQEVPAGWALLAKAKASWSFPR
ncbi:MAG: hypothetical protein K0S96_2065 [Geminicoccaceae bacterium]|nr:hypothetical protein [Geminicoccaceae bacterium]